ncbi:metallophosphoesterase family protein [Lacicoccus alkaliphilus]|uniref:Nuclease SbcCD subunit D n=1 Tax=Lacicoccus alkaliphilus DSM 16010 TaxID=1123231 RepID=A0A1M7BX60_9BACL|nr:exonuclease SbcCD subunit D [Salinicoccus alkaliphilus]SHL59571.1 Exodeoxyribonuclease I subunit D [Salinicoccus alkaliphilus DSM 16010]
MKILHTADWHIGKKLNGRDLMEDQEFVLDQLIGHIKEMKPDIIVIAGDIYDRSNPPREALNLVNRYLHKMNVEMGIPVLMNSGNHDSRALLDYGSAWFKATDLYIHTAIEEVFTPVTIGGIDFHLVPHIDVLEARQYFGESSLRTHQDVYEHIVERMGPDPTRKNILIGHLFIQEGKQSDSERALSIGMSEEVSSDVFRDFDHVLLGHLHHPFAINHEKIHYSGSLLKYSFNEVNQPKGFRWLDTDEGTVKFIPLPPKHDIVEYEGDFDDLINERIDFKDKSAYFKFILSNLSHVKEPMSKIRMIYPNTLELKVKTEDHGFNMTTIDMKETSDYDIYASFIEEVAKRPPTEIEMGIFKEHFGGGQNEAH